MLHIKTLLPLLLRNDDDNKVQQDSYEPKTRLICWWRQTHRHGGSSRDLSPLFPSRTAGQLRRLVVWHFTAETDCQRGEIMKMEDRFVRGAARMTGIGS
jgi:hypothetical protein